MNKKLMLSFLIVFSLAAFPCQAQSLKDAYVGINKKSFSKQFNYLALTPVLVDGALDMPESYKQMIADEVMKKFSKKKIKLLPASEISSINKQFIDLYPSGVNSNNVQLIDDHTKRELFYRHAVDGIISVNVLTVAAPFANDKAAWGGASQKIKHRGDGFIAAITGGKNYGGHIAASAVRVIVSDQNGQIVYNWMGGIEVLMERVGKKFELLPKDSLWQKERRVSSAIKYALKPL